MIDRVAPVYQYPGVTKDLIYLHDKMDTLTRIHMTAHFPSLVQALQ